MNVFKMAWRNILRNKRRSLVTIAAMTFALWVELLYSGLIPGYIGDMEKGVVDMEIGDIQIHAPSYLEGPSLYKTVDNAAQVLTTIEDAGLVVSPRLLGGGLAASGDFSAGVSLRGLDVQRDARASGLATRIGEGSWLGADDPKGVVLGRQLAKTLNAKVGSELVIVSQDYYGGIANDLFVVRGILRGVSQVTDRSSVFMHNDTFRELMMLSEGVHQMVIRRGERNLDEVTTQVSQIAPHADVKSWKQLMPDIAQMLESTEGLVYIFYFIIYLAVGILILNAMLTAVFERIREFGVLKAIGAGPERVFALIVVEAVYQTLIAMGLGFALALPFMFYLQNTGINVGVLGGTDAMGVAMSEIWKGIYSPKTVAGPVIMLWVIVLGAVLYPALKAAYIQPVQAMRHQ